MTQLDLFGETETIAVNDYYETMLDDGSPQCLHCKHMQLINDPKPLAPDKCRLYNMPVMADWGTCSCWEAADDAVMIKRMQEIRSNCRKEYQ